DRLREVGLLYSKDQAYTARYFPLLIILAVLAFGGIKLLVGLARNKPVGFLVVGLAVTAIVGLIITLRPIFRNRRGDAVVDTLKEHHVALKLTAESNQAQLTGRDLALAIGLFGMGILTYGALDELRRGFFPKGGSSCGSSCGGGSCGGGGGGCGG